MAFYDWNKKNDVISDFIGLKTNQEGPSDGRGLGCGGVLLLVACVLLFIIMLMKNCRIWVSLLVSGGVFTVVYIVARWFAYMRKK